MRIFRAQDMQRQGALMQDAAMLEPILITYHDRPRLVLMSVDEYDRLKGLKRERTRAAKRVRTLEEPAEEAVDAAE
jgi:prevent-host-death family protein